MRAQAEEFADLIGEFFVIDVPVIWIKELAPIRSIPLYGVASADAWLQPKTSSPVGDTNVHGEPRTSATA
jgi:hypothetical protein